MKRHLSSSICLDQVGRVSDSGRVLAEVAKPTTLAFDNRGQLIVCGDDPNQQLKFNDASSAKPKLSSTFGDKAGLHATGPASGHPPSCIRLAVPARRRGYPYVAPGFNGAPAGTLVLRSFTPPNPGETIDWRLVLDDDSKNASFANSDGDQGGKLVTRRQYETPEIDRNYFHRRLAWRHDCKPLCSTG